MGLSVLSQGLSVGVEYTTFPQPPILHLSVNLHTFDWKHKHTGWTRMQAIASYCNMDNGIKHPLTEMTNLPLYYLITILLWLDM